MAGKKRAPQKAAKRQAPKKAKRRDSIEPLRKALAKRTKAELIGALVESARGDRKILRELETQFDVETPSDDLMAATRQAILDATDFDEREINYNFDYDYAAYGTVERNLGRLANMGALEEAMELSLELMRRGSYQIEMSDEGLMTDDVEKCLDVVIEAVEKSDLEPEDVARWCDEMTRADRVGFICGTELKKLGRRVAT